MPRRCRSTSGGSRRSSGVKRRESEAFDAAPRRDGARRPDPAQPQGRDPASAQKVDLVRGRVEAHPDGYGFLVPDDGRTTSSCPPREMQQGHARRPRASRAIRRTTGAAAAKGEIVEVLERAQHAHRRPPARRARRAVRRRRGPAHPARHPDRARRRRGGAKPGQVVTVEIVAQPSRHSAADRRASSRCSAPTPTRAWRSRSRCASTSCRTSSRRRGARLAATPARRTVRAADARGDASTCADCRSSRSTARPRRTSTTPCSASRKGTGLPAASSRSPT